MSGIRTQLYHQGSTGSDWRWKEHNHTHCFDTETVLSTSSTVIMSNGWKGEAGAKINELLDKLADSKKRIKVNNMLATAAYLIQRQQEGGEQNADQETAEAIVSEVTTTEEGNQPPSWLDNEILSLMVALVAPGHRKDIVEMYGSSMQQGQPQPQQQQPQPPQQQPQPPLQQPQQPMDHIVLGADNDAASSIGADSVQLAAAAAAAAPGGVRDDPLENQPINNISSFEAGSEFSGMPPVVGGANELMIAPRGDTNVVNDDGSST